MEQVGVVEMRSWTPVCTLKSDSKLGMLMCMKICQMHNSSHLTNPRVSQLRIRADGKILAAAGWDNNIRVFGWKKLKPLAVLHHTDMVNSVAFSDHPDPQQRLLAAGSKDQRISVWSIYGES